ncbi:hypothetical protein [Rhodanobacter lindaniclasticus]
MIGCMVCSSLGIAPALELAREAAFVDLDGPFWLPHTTIPTACSCKAARCCCRRRPVLGWLRFVVAHRHDASGTPVVAMPRTDTTTTAGYARCPSFHWCRLPGCTYAQTHDSGG